MPELGVDRGPFDKPAIPIDDQVALLAKRGLLYDDAIRVAHYLTFIGYYRLSGYCRYYYTDLASAEPEFQANTSFDDVLNLYVFDRKLRNLLMDALERIEIAAKATITNAASLAGGPFWLTEAKSFDYGQHEFVMKLVEDALGKERENHQHTFIAHFYRRYDDPAYPPGWMLLEALSFASVSKIYKRLKGTHRQVASRHFGLQHDILESWLHALSFARNVCAHHQRIWNRTFTIQPKIPRQLAGSWPLDTGNALYSVCAMIHVLMTEIADGSQWSNRLRDLINARPGVPLHLMGFPNNWEQYEPWRLRLS